MAAYQRVRVSDKSLIDTSRKEKLQHWSPPPVNCFKLNVDAAINSNDQMVGLGAVIRNSEAKVVAAGVQISSLKGGVSYAEAEAIQWGFQVAKEASISSLIVESDCLEVVELINNTKGSRTEIFWVIAEIQKQSKQFQKCTIQHVPKTCNAHAYNLAKFGLQGKIMLSG